MTKPKKAKKKSGGSAFANLQALTGAQSGPLVPEFAGAVKNEKMRRQISRASSQSVRKQGGGLK